MDTSFTIMTASLKSSSIRSSGTLITTFGESSPTEVIESVKKINGVSSVRVNPTKRSVRIEYDPSLVSAIAIRAACRASPMRALGLF